MRKSRVETAETRRRIVEIAAREFTGKGIHATGLADVMAEAGLSHGGFYRHFDSKDHLVAEACTSGMTDVIGKLEAAATASAAQDGFKAIVDAYVSAGHRDNAARGCPIAGMGSELIRSEAETRAAATDSLDRLLALLVKHADEAEPEAARSKAVFALAAMIGGITMARIMTDADASMAVLQEVREHLDAL
ncbi:TetR/AcrR family transcriptional regulator [Paraburkholderia sp. DHOC27]|uniref:TetR/AcrR family transcriptional regulator n=1 Tax=Paraburkholderia sp. DHOC27 TaxID=2303330 RepID=UPI000E3C3837|nr:TetR/AcrR family transcriptional regulator [Paraburkholderia sp. DHOC27]RFU49427.1 TetR/AcrR family transcriptional regulator [Paraburkholderia sp. DHOC27]